MNQLFPQDPLLIVDDNKALLRSYEMVLKSNGFTNIILFSDGRKARRFILEDTNLSLVVLDLWMPHLPGEEILHILNREKPHLPVIIITGGGEPRGFNGRDFSNIYKLIRKPVDEAYLIEIIREVTVNGFPLI